MSVALITGSTGLVGSESVNFFCDKGFDVVGIDNNMRKFFFGPDGSTNWIKHKLLKRNKKFKNFNIDIRNYNNLEKIFKTYKKKFSLIIHCAAQPSHDYGKNYPIIDFNVNATGTLNLLELTKKYCPETPFIFMSTNKVYGDNPNKLKIIEKEKRWELNKQDKYFKGIGEKFSIDECTHSFFGVSKTYADLIVQEYGKNVGLKTVCFRAGCVTGPNHSGAKLHGFLSYLVKLSLTKKKYSLIGYKGKQVRDNIHSEDVVSALWEFYKTKNNNGVYNLGGGRENSCSILEVIDILKKKYGVKLKFQLMKKNRSGDHILYISDNSKFKAHHKNWKIKRNLEDIIAEIVKN